MQDDGASTARFFYGLLPSGWKLDRLYRVYVSDRLIAGAFIAGQIYDQQSAAIQLQQLGLILRPLVNRWLQQRQAREAEYDAIDPFGVSLLDHDLRNFQIRRSDVVRTRFRRKRSLWTAFNVGSVEIELLDQSRRRLILVGDQDPDGILELLQTFDPAIETIGRANPRPAPRLLSARGKRIRLTIVAVVVAAFGCASTYAALNAIKPIQVHVSLAVLNLVAAIGLLVEAYRAKDDRPDVD